MWYVLQVKTGDEIKVRDALLAKASGRWCRRSRG